MKIEELIQLHKTSKYEVVISKCEDTGKAGFCVTLSPDPAADEATKTAYRVNKSNNPNFYILESQRAPRKVFRVFQTAAHTLKKHGIENIRVVL